MTKGWKNVLLKLPFYKCTRMKTQIVASSGIKDTRYILFGIRQLDLPASQCWCSPWDSNPVPFASNAITNVIILNQVQIYCIKCEANTIVRLLSNLIKSNYSLNKVTKVYLTVILAYISLFSVEDQFWWTRNLNSEPSNWTLHV